MVDRTKETLAFEDKIKKIIPEKKMHFFYSKYSKIKIENLKNKKLFSFCWDWKSIKFF